MNDRPQDIVKALTLYGLSDFHLTPLPTKMSSVRRCASFRVDVGQSIILKARRMRNEATAQRQQALRVDLPGAFAPILFRCGAVLLEKWIVGRPLHEMPFTLHRTHIRQAAELLSVLHAWPTAGETVLPFPGDITGLRDDVVSSLSNLRTTGHLNRTTANRLIKIVETTAPEETSHCLIHTDLCGENLVVDSTGRLFVIDNEHFRVGPAGLDLARSWYRWGWYQNDQFPTAWNVFREAYETYGGRQDALMHEPFWRISAAAISARLRTHGAAADEPIRCLRTIACTVAP